MKARQELTLADCEKIAAAALAEARRNKWIVSIAILDDGGHLLHYVRMDGASPASAAISVEKARTAAVTRRTSGAWQERIKSRPEMLRMPGILPVQGGVPIFVGGKIVGAVGVSGVTGDQDEQCAKAGL